MKPISISVRFEDSSRFLLNQLQSFSRTLFFLANDPAKSLILNSLPTLPFEILRYLFKSTPISSEEGLNLRIAALKHGAVHVILACLAIFTHQPEAIHLADSGNQHVVCKLFGLDQTNVFMMNFISIFNHLICPLLSSKKQNLITCVMHPSNK